MAALVNSLSAAAVNGVKTGAGNGPPTSLTVLMAITCCSLGLVVGVLALGALLSFRKRKMEEDPDQQGQDRTR